MQLLPSSLHMMPCHRGIHSLSLLHPAGLDGKVRHQGLLGRVWLRAEKKFRENFLAF